MGLNRNLTLMAALGPCGNLNSAPLVLNEVTTVVSAWALAPFAANNPLTGNSSSIFIGASNSNQTGLANAFATVNNLVNLSTGQALFAVPAGNAAVPYAEINTIADLLNTCTATGGGSEGDGSACGQLFYYADPFSISLPCSWFLPPIRFRRRSTSRSSSVGGLRLPDRSAISLSVQPGGPFQPSGVPDLLCRWMS